MLAAIYYSVAIAVVFLLFKKWKRFSNFWEDRCLPHIKPYPIVGNMLQNIFKVKRSGEVFGDIGFKFKERPIVGIYNFMKPALLINSVDYALIVTIKEFSHFMDRVPEVKDRRAIDNHLFNLTGPEWKAVRMKMAPVFTTGKLKGMISLMEKCFYNTTKKIDSDQVLNLNNLLEIYSVNVRGACVYGMEKEVDQSFIKTVDSLTDMTIWKFIMLNVAVFFPKLAAKFKVSFIDHEVETQLSDLFVDTMRARAESGVPKNDFIQTALQLKQTGQVEVGQWSKEDEYLQMEERHLTKTVVDITDDMLFAQSMIFLLAGLDTLRTALTLALVEIVGNKRILETLKEEVDQTGVRHKSFNAQAIKEMKYLDMCVKETLRLYPPAELMTRHCVKDFVFPDGTRVEKGTNVFIAINRFHWDPEHFPEPKVFRPERFSSELDPPAYMPFGQGPRVCIAMRFALLEMKTFLANMIYNYDLTIDPKTKLPVKFDPWFFLLKAKTPVFMRVTKRVHGI